jgi:nitrite reductase/ring-hydroxylating ferredoxin subunit
MEGNGSKGDLAYGGYRQPKGGAPDRQLTSVGPGTPGGEYLRRFWQPVAYVSELNDVPLRARIMGEDLVVFRDGSGAIGVLHLHCSHRGTSLEFGLVAEHGIRCCYHGRVYDVDGRILEMPGERFADRMRQELSQGAYPTHVFAGLVFAYMGPIELKPPFPVYDRWDLPGVAIVPGPRMPFACNWVQVKENAMDPAHTAILHAIKGANQFADEFAKFPELAWGETPAGMMYAGVRRVGDRIWIRTTDVMAPNIHSISSIVEDGRNLKRCSAPWITIWTVPEDDDSCINFVISHLSEDDSMPLERRRFIELFGQTPARPYAERQRIPGDYDAMVSQGPTAVHAREHLGTLDQGVSIFRRLLRQGIEAVQQGRDPAGLVRDGQVIPTFGTDRVVPVSELDGNPDDPDALLAFARGVIPAYVAAPPLREWTRPAARSSAAE